MVRLIEFAGRLHPMLVHVPISILLLAALLLILDRHKRLETPAPVISFILLIGALTAVVSCMSGYLLSSEGDYAVDQLAQHKWMGIVLAAVSCIVWFLHKKKKLEGKLLYIASALIVILVIVAGHLGASLTHGSDYLLEPFTGSKNDLAMDYSVLLDPDTKFYSQVVAPVLKSKCYSCHGAEKQKGKLRLDNPDDILKGGKSGLAIVAGSLGEGELINRILLSPEDDDHMPPREKSQLNQKEVELLQLWIEHGADFEKTLSELVPQNRIKLLISRATAAPPETVLLPGNPSAPDAALVQKLINSGASVVPVARNSNHVSVNFISVPAQASTLLKELAPMKENVVWLKLSGCQISDADLTGINEFTNLTRLSIDGTSITDHGLMAISRLKFLTYLNLAGTAVTASGIEPLTANAQLKQLYLFQTKIDSAARSKLIARFPRTEIDFGGYAVTLIATDTLVVKTAVN